MTKSAFIQAVAQEVNGTVCTSEKANGVILEGITVKGEGNAAPNIYIDRFYDEGYTVEETAEEVRKIAKRSAANIDLSYFEDFDAVKSQLVALLYNEKTTAEVSRKAPAPFDDLIITAAVTVSNPVIGNGIIRVKPEHLELWGVTADEVLDIAEENSRKDATIQNMNEVLAEMDAPESMLLDDCPMWVISNTRRTNGAYGVIALLDQLKDRFKSFTVLPSSVHEVLVVTVDSDEYDSMVQEVNDTQVDYTDQLSNHAYKIA